MPRTALSEIWKAAPGFEACYRVSDAGRVMTLRKSQKGFPGHIMALQPHPAGYLQVRLGDRDGHARSVLVHRLVAQAFVGPMPSGTEVNHKNGDKRDNTASNLEYMTRSENTKHSYQQLGRINGMKGRAHPHRKLSTRNVATIRSLLADGEKQRVVARAFGVSQQTIFRIKHGLARANG